MKITLDDGNVRYVSLSEAACVGYSASSIELDEEDMKRFESLIREDPSTAYRLCLQLRGRIHRFRPSPGLSGTRPNLVIVDEVAGATPESFKYATDSAQKAAIEAKVPRKPETPTSEADRRQTEHVHFRLITLPCCGHLFCNVNPRLPSYCPMCGKSVYPEIKSCVTISDENVVLKWRME